MKPRVLLGSAVVFAWACSLASATVQERDSLLWGDAKFYIYQSPILGLWYSGPGTVPEGMTRPPEFEWTGTSNRKGYSPTWEIRDGKLFLLTITGRFKGKDIEDEAILRGRRFPIVARWFTGRIHLPVGDINSKTRESEAVIVLQIDKGRVQSVAYFSAARVSTTWNGLQNEQKVAGE